MVDKTFEQVFKEEFFRMPWQKKEKKILSWDLGTNDQCVEATVINGKIHGIKTISTKVTGEIQGSARKEVDVSTALPRENIK